MNVGKLGCTLATFAINLSPILISPIICPAAEFMKYSNERYHVSFSYPADWESKKATISGDRTVDAFVDPKDPETSVSIVISPIPADYTRLESFGGKETLRNYVLPSGEGVSSKVLKESIKGNTYFLEYEIEAPEIKSRHIQSAFALRPQESVIGLTVQSREDSYESNKDLIDLIMPSLNIDN